MERTSAGIRQLEGGCVEAGKDENQNNKKTTTRKSETMQDTKHEIANRPLKAEVFFGIFACKGY